MSQSPAELTSQGSTNQTVKVRVKKRSTTRQITNEDIYGKLEEVRNLVKQLLAAYKMVNSEAIEKGRESILKDKRRRKIYDLCDKSKSVSKIAQTVFPGKPLKTSLPTVSYHLSILEDYGLVTYLDKEGQRYYYKIRG